MTYFWQFLYNYLFLPLLWVVLHFASFFSSKVALGIRGRRGALKRLEAASLNIKGPVVWFHVTSAGELLQALPLVDALKLRQPKTQFVLTYYSPSAISWAKKVNTFAVTEYLPFDWSSHAKELFRILQPRAMVLIGAELWPNLIWTSRKMGVPAFLYCATLRAHSLRYKMGIARSFYRDLYKSFATLSCASHDDLKRYSELISDPHKLCTEGDVRGESVLNRIQSLQKDKKDSVIESRIRNSAKKILILGSSWPDDEHLVFSKWRSLESLAAELLILIVPHEPSPEHWKQSHALLSALGLSVLTYSVLENQLALNRDAALPEVIWVDKIGTLASLYALASISFVGSGQAGVHNVYEPAAWKCPVYFGPRFANSPDARNLIAMGAARSCANASEWITELDLFLKNPSAAKQRAELAFAHLERSLGSAASAVEPLVRVLTARGKADETKKVL